MLPQNRFRYFNPSAPSARIMPELPTNSAEEPSLYCFLDAVLLQNKIRHGTHGTHGSKEGCPRRWPRPETRRILAAPVPLDPYR